MRKAPVPLVRPLSPFVISAISEDGVRLQSRREIMDLRVLAVDLFRLRVARRAALSERPSWAVAKTDWPPVPARIRARRGGVSIQTTDGKLMLRLADGFWKLLDGSGDEV